MTEEVQVDTETEVQTQVETEEESKKSTKGRMLISVDDPKKAFKFLITNCEDAYLTELTKRLSSYIEVV